MWLDEVYQGKTVRTLMSSLIRVSVDKNIIWEKYMMVDSGPVAMGSSNELVNL